MSSTRPPSNDAADIAKWEAEQERSLQREEDERQFRDDMRSFAGRSGEALTHITKTMEDHALEDRRQFRRAHRRMSALENKIGTVTQTVGDTSNRYAIAWAVLGAAVTIFGIVWLFFDKVYSK